MKKVVTQSSACNFSLSPHAFHEILYHPPRNLATALPYMYQAQVDEAITRGAFKEKCDKSLLSNLLTDLMLTEEAFQFDFDENRDSVYFDSDLSTTIKKVSTSIYHV